MYCKKIASENDKANGFNVVLPRLKLKTALLQGGKNLYAIIVRRYNQRLYCIGMSIINDDIEIEDVMQVTYINAYENL